MDFHFPNKNDSSTNNWMFKSNNWNEEYAYSVPLKKPRNNPAIDIQRLHSMNRLNDKIKRNASMKQEVSTITNTIFFEAEDDEQDYVDKTTNVGTKVKSLDDIRLGSSYSGPNEYINHAYQHDEPFAKQEDTIDTSPTGSTISDTSLNELYSQRHQAFFFDPPPPPQRGRQVRRNKTVNAYYPSNKFYPHPRSQPPFRGTRRSHSYHVPYHIPNVKHRPPVKRYNYINNCRSYNPKMLRRDSLYYSICDICSRTHRPDMESCNKGSSSEQAIHVDPLTFKYHYPYEDLRNSRYAKARQDYESSKFSSGDGIGSGKTSKDELILKPGALWKAPKDNAAAERNINNRNYKNPSPIFRYGQTAIQNYDYEVYAREMKEKANEKKKRTIIALITCFVAFVLVVAAGVVIAAQY
uniref:Serine/threonine-protein kinase n=1 Tax=Rhabditophanes sp. KR3021 TaxID=114890 RepID=A0AC35TKB1_9BILA